MGGEDAGAGTDPTPVMKGGGEDGQEEPQALVQLEAEPCSES